MEENDKRQQEELIKEKEEQIEKDDGNKIIKKDDLNNAKDRPQTSTNPNFSQNNIQAMPNILTPTIAESVDENSKKTNDSLRHIDITPFENEQDPFDKVELLSIDDMEELGKVYSTMSNSKPAPYAQVASKIVSVKDLDFPIEDNTSDNQSNLNEQRSIEKAPKLPPLGYDDIQNGEVNMRPMRSSKSNPDVHSNLYDYRSSSRSPPPRPSSGQVNILYQF